MGPRDAARLLPSRPLAEAARLFGGDASASRGHGRSTPRGVPQSLRARAGGCVGDLRGRPGRRLQHGRGTRRHTRLAGHELLRRALDAFGLASLAEAEEAPPEVRELAERRQLARSNGDYEEGDRLRAEIE